MSDLAAWLREQLAEDERVAQAASGVPWDESVPGAIHVAAAVIRENKRAYGALGHVATVEHDEYRAHIALWDPARVLAEVEAKRYIVDRYEYARRAAEGPPQINELQSEWEWCETELEDIVLKLAALYADRPGYQPEWETSGFCIPESGDR